MNSDAARTGTQLWMLRPVLWFATAYTLIIIVHETAHALTAVALGAPSMLFNFWVDHDFSRATLNGRAASGVAGPTFSLLAGIVSWFIYRRLKDGQWALPFLYLAAFGVTNFFGNLMSAAFFGDFSNAAVLFDLSPAMRSAASITGAVAVAVTLFVAGRELARLAPRHAGRFTAVLGLIVLPALIGTALVIVVNQPTPMGFSFVTARAGEGAFWLFTAIGMITKRTGAPADGGRWNVHSMDVAIAVVALVAVRIMAMGIPLQR